MRTLSPILLLLLAVPATAQDSVPDERTFCRSEHERVERRRKILRAEGFSPEDVKGRLAPDLRALDDCRERFRSQQAGPGDGRSDEQEVARRAGPNATEKERRAALREIRLERLSSKRASTLTEEERAELAAGLKEEMAATHAALDAAHARDRAFMRTVHSALACYHTERKEALQNQVASEEALLKLGAGDKQALYALQSALRRSDEVLARSSDAARGYALGLERCSAPTIALLAHCVGIHLEGKAALSACEPEEVQQYLRFAK
jgi:hypothetical protein